MKTLERKVSKSSKEDLALIEKFKSSNKMESDKAFEKLFNKYHNSIKFHFNSMSKEEQITEELVMDTFIKASKNIAQFNDETAAFSTWLFSMAKNIFIDNLRKAKNDVTRIGDMTHIGTDGTEVQVEIRCDDKNAEQNMISNSDRKIIRRIVDEIENKDIRGFIKMRFFEGLAYDEIVEFSGRPIGTVKAFIFRGKEILKEKLVKANLTAF